MRMWSFFIRSAIFLGVFWLAVAADTTVERLLFILLLFQLIEGWRAGFVFKTLMRRIDELERQINSDAAFMRRHLGGTPI